MNSLSSSSSLSSVDFLNHRLSKSTLANTRIHDKTNILAKLLAQIGIGSTENNNNNNNNNAINHNNNPSISSPSSIPGSRVLSHLVSIQSFCAQASEITRQTQKNPNNENDLQPLSTAIDSILNIINSVNLSRFQSSGSNSGSTSTKILSSVASKTASISSSPKQSPHHSPFTSNSSSPRARSPSHSHHPSIVNNSNTNSHVTTNSARPPIYSRIKSIQQPINGNAIVHSADVQFINGKWQPVTNSASFDTSKIDSQPSNPFDDEFDELDAIPDLDDPSQNAAEKKAQKLAAMAAEQRKREQASKVTDARAADLADIDDSQISIEKLTLKTQKHDSETDTDAPKPVFVNGRWTTDIVESDDLDLIEDFDPIQIKQEEEERAKLMAEQKKQREFIAKLSQTNSRGSKTNSRSSSREFGAHVRALTADISDLNSEDLEGFDDLISDTDSERGESSISRGHTRSKSSSSTEFSASDSPKNLTPATSSQQNKGSLVVRPSSRPGSQNNSAHNTPSSKQQNTQIHHHQIHQQIHNPRNQTLKADKMSKLQAINSKFISGGAKTTTHAEYSSKTLPSAKFVKSRNQSEDLDTHVPHVGPMIFANVFHLEPSKQSLEIKHPEDDYAALEEADKATADSDNDESAGLQIKRKSSIRPDTLEGIDLSDNDNEQPNNTKNNDKNRTESPPTVATIVIAPIDSGNTHPTDRSSISTHNKVAKSPVEFVPSIASPSKRFSISSNSSRSGNRNSLTVPSAGLGRSLLQLSNNNNNQTSVDESVTFNPDLEDGDFNYEKSIVNLRSSEYTEHDLEEMEQLNEEIEHDISFGGKLKLDLDDLDDFDMDSGDDDIEISSNLHLTPKLPLTESSNRSLENLYEFVQTPELLNHIRQAEQAQKKLMGSVDFKSFNPSDSVVDFNWLNNQANQLVARDLIPHPEVHHLPRKLRVSLGLSAEEALEINNSAEQTQEDLDELIDDVDENSLELDDIPDDEETVQKITIAAKTNNKSAVSPAMRTFNSAADIQQFQSQLKQHKPIQELEEDDTDWD